MNDYPRPGMRRKSFYSLNGKWEYQICKNDNKKEYVETINVPYSPESVLSGVNKVLYPSEELWYRKK